ncbi:MAG: porin, partial [Pseudomonadota bacterium]
ATPDFGGFTAAASYSFGENKNLPAPNVWAAGKVAAFNVAYSGGPVFIGLAYQAEKANGSVPATKFTQINASYDLGAAKLLGAYGNVKNGVDVSGVAAPKIKEYQLGVDVPVGGAFTLSGGFASSKSTGIAASIKHTGFGLAGLYALSKRTNLYAGFQNAKQEQAAVTSKITTYAAGVRHTF